MKKSLLILLLMAMFVPFAMHGQELTVCDGTVTNQYVPIYGYWADNAQHNQMIYPATDLSAMAGKNITQMVFYISEGISGNDIGSWTIKLGETDATTLTGLDATTSLTQVYSGAMSFDTDRSTMTIAFSDSYTYHGGNLLVDFTHSSASWRRIFFYGIEATSAAVYQYGSYSATVQDFLPKNTFSYEAPAATPKPTNLTVSNILHNAATLSWTENGTATSWQICINDDEDNPITVTTNPYTLSNLTPITQYTVKVRSIGSSEYSAWSASVSFSTTAVAEVVGNSWSDDFEGATCGWELINGTCTNAWVWGTATSNGGSHALYISNDEGTTNAYTNNSAAMVYATKLLSFADAKYEFSYDWIANGESTWDFLRVALVPASVTLTAGTSLPSGLTTTAVPSGWIALDGGSKLNLVTEWQNKSVAVNVTAGNYYLVMAWRDDTSGGSNPPAAIDNVSINVVACGYDVEDLAVSNITTDEATLSWTAGEAQQWQVAYSTNSTFEGATETIVNAATYNLTGLTSATTYYAKVRAYCGGEDFGSWSATVQFTTACEAFSEYPFTENFDNITGVTSGSVNLLPDCWDYINTTTYSYCQGYPLVYSASGYSNSGNNHLRFYTYYSSYGSYDPQDQYAILPPMENLKGKQLTLFARGANTNSSFTVGMMTDPTDVSTFTPITTTAPTTSYEEYNYILGEGNYVAIKVEAANSSITSRTVYIDDITIDVAPTCFKPLDLAVSNVDKRSAELSWTSQGDETAWQICLNGDEDDLIDADSNPFTLTRLDPETHYTVKVRANCGAEDGVSYWSDEVSFTTLVACPVPTGLIVSDINPTSANVSWNGNADSYNLRYRETTVSNMATVTLTAGDVWGDGTGYQMLLDADATAYGTTIPTSGPLTSEGNASAATYAEFEYKIPTNADGSLTTSNIVIDNSISIMIPAGTYDWCITNPTPDDRVWIASSNGNIGGRADDYVFEVGKTYEFTVTLGSNDNDQVDVTITGGTKNGVRDENEWFVIENVTSPYLLEDLAEETSYEVQVQAICGDEDGESAWSSSYYFETPSACDVPYDLEVSNILHASATLNWSGYQEDYNLQYRTASYKVALFEEGFENGIGQWQVITNSTANNAGINASAANTGSNGFMFSSYSQSSDYNQYLISPALTTTGTLTFYYKKSNSANEVFQVGYSIEGTEVEDFTWGDEIEVTNAGWQLFEEEMPSNAKYFAIHYYSNYLYYLYIDDIVILGGDVEAGEWIDVEQPIVSPYVLNGLSSGTDYDWRVQGVCPNATTPWSEGSFSTPDENLKIFITEGFWDEATNWDPEGAPRTDNDVLIIADAIIPEGVIAQCANTTIDGGSITIKDGGQLKQKSNNLQVTVEKSIDAYPDATTKSGYYFITTPLTTTTYSTQVENLLTGNYDYYYFNSGNELEWCNYRATTFNMNPGQGYLYANSDDKVLKFNGKIRPGINQAIYFNNVSFSYSNESTDEFNGWGLVGNPFTCTGYIYYLDTSLEEQLEVNFYVMNSRGDGYELSSSEDGLAPCQGAFMEFAQSGYPTFWTEPLENEKSGILNMNLTQGNTKIDQARIRFGEGVSLGKKSFREDSKLYIPQDGDDFAVVYAGEMGEMPVNFKAVKNGSYTIDFSNIAVEFSYLHLIDNLTGNEVDLLKTPSYSFDAKISDYASRFRLVFATGNNSNDDSFAFYNNGNLVINNDGAAVLNIVDVLGRTISSQNINGSQNVSIDAKAGVYMLQLIQGENVRTQKIVVE